jgi:hypothetical protein
VQDHQAQGPRHGHLRESEAQAEAGLIHAKQNPGRFGSGFLFLKMDSTGRKAFLPPGKLRAIGAEKGSEEFP